MFSELEATALVYSVKSSALTVDVLSIFSLNIFNSNVKRTKPSDTLKSNMCRSDQRCGMILESGLLFLPDVKVTRRELLRRMSDTLWFLHIPSGVFQNQNIMPAWLCSCDLGAYILGERAAWLYEHRTGWSQAVPGSRNTQQSSVELFPFYLPNRPLTDDWTEFCAHDFCLQFNSQLEICLCEVTVKIALQKRPLFSASFQKDKQIRIGANPLKNTHI